MELNHKKYSNLRKLSWVLFVALILTSGACNKSRNERWLYYDETYCADAWQRSNTNEILKQNITDYFKTKDVEIFDIEIFSDRDPESCQACNCKSGRRIKCKIGKSDVSEMKKNGFYE